MPSIEKNQYFSPVCNSIDLRPQWPAAQKAIKNKKLRWRPTGNVGEDGAGFPTTKRRRFLTIQSRPSILGTRTCPFTIQRRIQTVPRISVYEWKSLNINKIWNGILLNVMVGCGSFVKVIRAKTAQCCEAGEVSFKERQHMGAFNHVPGSVCMSVTLS